MQKKLLLIDPDGVHLRWMARAINLGVSDVEVHSRTSSTSDDEPCDFVVMSYDFLDTEMLAKQIRSVRHHHPEVPCLLISSDKHIYPQLLARSGDRGLMNMLARKYQRGWAPPNDFVVTLQKLVHRDIFGIDKYLPRWSAEPISMAVRSTADKAEVLERASDHLSELAIHPRLVPQVVTVLDEAITNALYSGPCDDRGRPRFSHLTRKTDVHLEGDEQIAVRLCYDGSRFGVSVSDPFGSLTRDTIFEHLRRCFRRGRAQVDDHPGGNGLHLCFESLSHLVINISAGRCTEVIGLLDVRGTYLDYVNEGKSFNVFEMTEGGTP